MCASIGKTEKLLAEDTFYVVEADSFSQHQLWCNYATDSWLRPKDNNGETWKGYEWRQEVGELITVGFLDKRPVNITAMPVIVGGYRVIFWDAVSQVVDHKMIEEWFKKHWSGGTCNAMNFHHCLNAIDQAEKELQDGIEKMSKRARQRV